MGRNVLRFDAVVHCRGFHASQLILDRNLAADDCSCWYDQLVNIYWIRLKILLFLGMFWPLEGMPTILKYFSYLMPFTLPSISVRNIMAKGYSFFHPSVLIGFGVVTIWTIMGIFCGLKALQLRKYSRNT